MSTVVPAAAHPLARTVGDALPITLDEVNERAQLLTRFDRSYLVPAAVLTDLVARLTDGQRPGGPFRALTIDGRRAFHYHSVYYDTPQLRSFHEHRQGRRLRFKIRERVYRDSGERQFEIKLKGRRGDTVKHRRPLTGTDTPLDPPYRAYLAATLRERYGIDAPRELAPSLSTDYLRATLVADGERVTCDAGLLCTDLHTGAAARCATGLVLVETKSAGHLTDADRVLHDHGIRPAVFTKYCGAFAALRPALPGNRWRRAAARAFTADARGATFTADAHG
ncbi:polyphosphate polymerase domain-containing protein [Streptomyces sp. AV19]|uniref:polyphosphate polymerase domain-containing protein n=1 Tax=Streptomyces sp. AV19 TaxID=2793068 RepID=UPI0018FE3099|nr:polyphosphate polymerase domain-containing protein [Streptomyces sp. AV19]MBH1936924.1 polyphosphate polymerase domain-containing protein [Streptomyces sp. AV19]MDG4532967.1 polyphosphate polymerase domain-containing protein [Streptomyces sp. AV19]